MIFFRKYESAILISPETLGFIFLVLIVLLILTRYLLKVTNKKRNSLYQVSKLLKDVMAYMESSYTDEKKKYEYFIDSLFEKREEGPQKDSPPDSSSEAPRQAKDKNDENSPPDDPRE